MRDYYINFLNLRSSSKIGAICQPDARSARRPDVVLLSHQGHYQKNNQDVQKNSEHTNK
jgi:hypothetical protein